MTNDIKNIVDHLIELLKLEVTDSFPIKNPNVILVCTKKEGDMVRFGRVNAISNVDNIFSEKFINEFDVVVLPQLKLHIKSDELKCVAWSKLVCKTIVAEDGSERVAKGLCMICETIDETIVTCTELILNQTVDSDGNFINHPTFGGNIELTQKFKTRFHSLFARAKCIKFKKLDFLEIWDKNNKIEEEIKELAEVSFLN